MALWVLDTDHVSLFQHEHPRIVQQLRLKRTDEIATTIVTFEEQVRGWLAVIRRSPDPATLTRGYSKLTTARRFFSDISVLDFTEAGAVKYTQLLSQY